MASNYVFWRSHAHKVVYNSSISQRHTHRYLAIYLSIYIRKFISLSVSCLCSSIYLSAAYLFPNHSINTIISSSTYQSVHLPIPIYTDIYPYIVTIHLNIYLSTIYLFASLSIYLSIDISSFSHRNISYNQNTSSNFVVFRRKNDDTYYIAK